MATLLLYKSVTFDIVFLILVQTIAIVTSRDYIFYFSQWYATVLLIFAPTFRREVAREGCGAYERDRWNNFFFIIFIYFNKQKFLFKNWTSLKFISIYNLNLILSFFISIYELDRLDRCSELTFIFHVIHFIFGARPSWSNLQVQLNLIISFRYSARRLRGVYLYLDMVSSPTSAKIADAALWGLGAWRAPTVIAVWNILKNSKWIKTQFIYELLLKCLVNWLMYQKRSRTGRNSHQYIFWASL